MSGWWDQAACRDLMGERAEELFFPSSNSVMFDQVIFTSKQMCAGCPVWAECLSEAMRSQEPFGTWGGLTEWERQWLREHPDHDPVTSHETCGRQGGGLGGRCASCARHRRLLLMGMRVPCEECGVDFTPTRFDMRFCTPSCSSRWVGKLNRREQASA